MTGPEVDGKRRISVELPDHLVRWVDSLKEEWGLRARGDCLSRLLEELLPGDPDQTETEVHDEPVRVATKEPNDSEPSPPYRDDCALVLISEKGVGLQAPPGQDPSFAGFSNSGFSRDEKPGIDLPGFVRRSTTQLRNSLQQRTQETDRSDETLLLPPIGPGDLQACAEEALQHWLNLYGQAPGPTVLEAAMLWLARDIWPSAEGSEGRTFTWSQAARQIDQRCEGWVNASPSFGQVMVVAGVLEDPFATTDLIHRMPTLIRRFVNRFKRSRRTTSFEALQSTMTVHGALKLLGLPTQAGASLTLRAIRDAYKQRAMETHPDAGGSTDAMRRLNEAYQMLRELYRQK